MWSPLFYDCTITRMRKTKEADNSKSRPKLESAELPHHRQRRRCARLFWNTALSDLLKLHEHLPPWPRNSTLGCAPRVTVTFRITQSNLLSYCPGREAQSDAFQFLLLASRLRDFCLILNDVGLSVFSYKFLWTSNSITNWQCWWKAW